MKSYTSISRNERERRMCSGRLHMVAGVMAFTLSTAIPSHGAISILFEEKIAGTIIVTVAGTIDPGVIVNSQAFGSATQGAVRSNYEGLYAIAGSSSIYRGSLAESSVTPFANATSYTDDLVVTLIEGDSFGFQLQKWWVSGSEEGTTTSNFYRRVNAAPGETMNSTLSIDAALADLGLAPGHNGAFSIGSQNFTWGVGSISAIPEPSGNGVLSVLMFLLGLSHRRRGGGLSGVLLGRGGLAARRKAT